MYFHLFLMIFPIRFSSWAGWAAPRAGRFESTPLQPGPRYCTKSWFKHGFRGLPNHLCKSGFPAGLAGLGLGLVGSKVPPGSPAARYLRARGKQKAANGNGIHSTEYVLEQTKHPLPIGMHEVMPQRQIYENLLACIRQIWDFCFTCIHQISIFVRPAYA